MAPDPQRLNLRDLFGRRFTCACSPGREYHSLRAFNAHHYARHGGYWAGKAGKAMRREMGKEVDAARRHARGWLEAAGLVDRYGHRTDRARTRPQVSGLAGLRDLRRLHQHDRHHERAGRLDGRADRAAGRGRHGRAAKHQNTADSLRSRWGTPSREAQETAARQRAEAAAQARTGPAPAPNGDRPAPQRTGRTRT